MTTTEIILSILGSSVLSSSLTAIVNFQLQKNNYRKEYYKKLLDKRIDAYERIEHIISEMSMLVSNNKALYPHFFSNKKSYNQFAVDLALIKNLSLWMEVTTADKLSDINQFLHNQVFNKIDENQDYNEQLIELGIKHREHLKKEREILRSYVVSDLKELHKIKDFLNDNHFSHARYKVMQKPILLQKKKDK